MIKIERPTDRRLRRAFGGAAAALAALIALSSCGDSVYDAAQTASSDAPLGDSAGLDGLGDSQPDGGMDTVAPDVTADLAEVAIDNIPPTLQIVEPKPEFVINIGDTLGVQVQVGDDVTKPDSMQVAVFNGATEVCKGLAGADGKFSCVAKNLPAGPLTLLAKVADDNNNEASAGVTGLVNTAPGAPVVVIAPLKPTTADKLVASVSQDASDPDRKPSALTYSWAWTRDGAPAASSAEVPAGLAKKGELWTATATAKDPYATGKSGTASVIIANSAPQAAELALAPTSVYLTTVVTCDLATAATDADGDALISKFTWFLNGVALPDAASATLDVATAKTAAGGLIKAGDQLHCSLESGDGAAVATASSATASIGDVDICATANPCAANGLCSNNGSALPSCACKTGFVGDGKTCSDVDECADGSAGCDLAADCSNSAGSFSCACKPGYSGDGKTCSDVDECLTNNGGCDLAADCSNSTGTFACACKPGYSGDGKICSDVDECLTNNGGCDNNAACSNSAGSFSCACKPGYSGDGKTCSDVDECLTNNGGCDNNAACSNSAGSFSCACKTGYSGDGKTCSDVDECLTNNGGCDNNAACTNSTGSFSCACKPGYSGDGKTCSDVDECALSFDATPLAIDADLPGWKVANSAPTVGWFAQNGTLYYSNPSLTSYDTGAANQGKAVSPKWLVPANVPMALALDITLAVETVSSYDKFSIELAAGATPVVVFSKAEGQTGKVHLELSLAAYAGKEIQVSFLFDTVDHIANATAGIAVGAIKLVPMPCGANATCSNTAGSYSCGCNSGYAGDGLTCKDVNECLTNNGGCDNNAECTNSAGSFTCACKVFWQGDGKTCGDINECASDNGGCGAASAYKCSNNVGSAPTCSDINECAAGTANCDANAACSNTVGSYNCACKTYWQGNGVTCSDIDECANKNGGCGSAAAFKCTNNTGAPPNCSDINECLTNNGGCDANATCANTTGSFTCACKTGYAGDGKTCAAPGTSANPGKDCKTILAIVPGAASGVYELDPDGAGGVAAYSAHCEMKVSDGTTVGGWSLAMKVDGNKTTFVYGSPLWTNTTLLNANLPAVDTNEAKLQTFNGVPVTQILVRMVVEGVTRDLVVPIGGGKTLAQLFQGGAVDSVVGRTAWKGLIGPKASLQPYCSSEGINRVCGGDTAVRIGIVANQENDCGSCDSRIGVGGTGTYCGQDANNAAGNEARCTPDNGDLSLRGFAHVYVR